MNLELLTARLRLEPLTESDVDLSLEMFTDPEVVEYVCDLMTDDEIRQEMRNWIKRGGNGCIGIWCISDRVSGEKYGSVFLLPIPIEEDDTDYDLIIPGVMPESDIEVGFALKRAAWGMGYATEACRRLLHFAFKESPLDVVVATFEEENLASKNVLKKAGLIDMGRMRSYGQDSPCYRITRDEWNQQQRAELS